MKRANFKTIYVTLICLIITLLCGCNLFVTDKDKFYLDKDLDYMLTWIDLEKTGSDIIIPSKVGNKTVKKISLKDPYFSGIDSLDVSHVEDLESFKLGLFVEKNKSKLKKLDFSKNKKLKSILVSETNTLNEIIFNNNCEDIYLEGTSVKKINIKLLKNLRDFSYYNGPLEELDVSNNPYLEQIWIENANIKVLDVSKNPKLKNIIVDEGTQIIGPTNAHIEYNKRAE
ncbi:hypothetical protein [Mogibacterium diversum]|uniref:hypothetical protein n=1 Tax=Mogibacterium diversum TaxID=114527 RepID=UPI0028D085F7|nr:hypothetical protein [Mogibacterium diversum]